MQHFKKSSRENNNSPTPDGNKYIFGEREKVDRPIAMDDVSGLANKSNNFASFLTVARKFGYSCVCIFYIIYPEKTIWKLILSQKKIFNSFPGSAGQFSLLKIISANCLCKTVPYGPSFVILMWKQTISFTIFLSAKQSRSKKSSETTFSATSELKDFYCEKMTQAILDQELAQIIEKAISPISSSKTWWKT